MRSSLVDDPRRTPPAQLRFRHGRDHQPQQGPQGPRQSEAKASAAENRVRHGRTKADKTLDAARTEKAARELESSAAKKTSDDP
jgi:hypothetical protein